MAEHTNRREEIRYESNINTSSSRASSNGRRHMASMSLLSVTSVLVLLIVFLSACGSTNAPTSQASSSTQVKKHATTCTPQATLPADIPASGALDTGANVIATFNNARQQEGCAVSLSIDPAAYDAATPQMQELMVINAERQDRGLGALKLDSTLLSQISMNHSKELVQYNYFNHSSPINQPGGKNGPDSRILVNPTLKASFSGWGENIAGGGPAAGDIYRFMYVDSASNWGHRSNILGNFTWIGIGTATGGKYGFYTTLDFFLDSTAAAYTPPATADTQAPKMSPPTVVDANTVQVTGVQDDRGCVERSSRSA